MYQDHDWTRQAAGDLEGGRYRRLHPIGAKGVLAISAYGLLTLAYFAYRIPLWNPIESPIFTHFWAFCGYAL